MNRRHFIKNTTITSLGLGCTPPQYFLGKNQNRLLYPELSKHKIDKVEVIELNFRWPRLVGKNALKVVHGQHRKQRALRLLTQQGASAWGMSQLKDTEAAKPLIGKTVAELISPTEGIFEGVDKHFEFALFDLAGIILEKPVYQLLGAKGAKETPVYSGMIYFDELEPPEKPSGIEQVLANCQWDYDFGYRQLKVKIGRSHKWYQHDAGLKMDIDIMHRIHDRFKDVELLVDANDGYSLEDAKAFLTGIKGMPLYWFEEPFLEDALQSQALRQWMNENGFEKTYLADGEVSPKIPQLIEMAKAKTLDVILPDTYSYGFTNWIKLLPELQKIGALASPHAFGDMLKTNYTAHLAAGLGNICTIEGVTCLSDDIDYGDYKIKNGKLHVSEKAGFGMRLLKK